MDFTKAWNIFINNQSLFMYGIRITLMMALIGTLAGLIIGLILGSIRVIEIEPRDSAFTKIIKKYCVVLSVYMSGSSEVHR